MRRSLFTTPRRKLPTLIARTAAQEARDSLAVGESTAAVNSRTAKLCAAMAICSPENRAVNSERAAWRASQRLCAAMVSSQPRGWAS